jgi:hypothetical protein
MNAFNKKSFSNLKYLKFERIYLNSISIFNIIFKKLNHCLD